jgi:hypothetical protein
LAVGASDMTEPSKLTSKMPPSKNGQIEMSSFLS